MAKIRDGSTYLSAHLSANDYYSEHESVRGRWTGRAADRLGLNGDLGAGDAAFEALRNNRHPADGSKLTPRDRADRICFFDFQCSAQKSVSIMAITMGDERLLAAHDLAAGFAFRELERFAACQANTAAERVQRLTGNVVAAAFRHTASRALDPQVHTHFVVANATWDETTASWRALTEFEMVAAIRFAGKTYQNELARACRALGYEIRPAHDDRGAITGFEIVGVSPEICQRFSKRRVEIEAGIAAFEVRTGRSPSAAEIHAITLETRDSKLAEITTPEVLARQRGELSAAELSGLTRVRAEAQTRAQSGYTITDNARESEALRHATAHLFERQSVVAGHALVAEALNSGLGHLDHGSLCVAASVGKLVPLTSEGWLHAKHATAQGIALERWSVAFVDRTRGRCEPLGQTVESGMAGLSEEQRRAVAEVLASRDQVVCLRGAAGVGKTTVQNVLNAAFAAQGLAVWHCTPTTSAADTLRKEGIEGATTVRDFLCNIAPAGDGRLEGCVLVVDEAGLASNRDGAELLQIAERWNARILFVGDSRQHTAVEAGDFLRILESHSSLCRVDLNAIRRQQTEAYRSAIGRMAAGAPREGLEQLDTLGWIREHGPDYLHEAAKAAIERSDGGRCLDRVIVVTPTWAENRSVTESLRTELKRLGVLTDGREVEVEEPLPWTQAEKRLATNYQPGMSVTFSKGRAGIAKGTTLRVVRSEADRVWLERAHGEVELKLKTDRFEVAAPTPLEVCVGDRLLVRANDRTQGLHNGDVVTVTALDGETLRTSDGRSIDLRRFRRLSHGFVVTSHKSQSRTADHVVVAAERLNAKSAYVACSRGRHSVLVHTPAKEALLLSMPSGERHAALDFLPSRERSAPVAGRHSRANRTRRLGRARSATPALPLPAWCRRVFGRVTDWWERVRTTRDHPSTVDLHR